MPGAGDALIAYVEEWLGDEEATAATVVQTETPR